MGTEAIIAVGAVIAIALGGLAFSIYRMGRSDARRAEAEQKQKEQGARIHQLGRRNRTGRKLARRLRGKDSES